MATAKNSLALSPALQAQIEAAAVEEHRPDVEVLSDVVDLETQHGTLRTEWELQQAPDLGLPADDPALTAEYQQTIREKLEQGLESVRQGRVVDGEAVFARIEAELVPLANFKIGLLEEQVLGCAPEFFEPMGEAEINLCEEG